MAKKKVTRKDLLKSPDEFLSLSEKAALFFSAHRRQFETLGYVLVGIALVYLAVHTYFRYVNKKGQEAYNKAYSALSEATREEPDIQKIGEAGGLFSTVVDEYGHSKVAPLAVPQLAWTKSLQKEYDEAISLYKDFLDEISGDPLYESLTRLALATCYESKGEFKAAVENLETVMILPENPFTEMALFNLARVYRLDHQPERAKETLKKFIEEYEDSPFVPMAKALL